MPGRGSQGRPSNDRQPAVVREPEWVLIEGRHPVAEALRAGRVIREVLVDEGVRPEGIEVIERLAEEREVPVRRVPRDTFRRLVTTAAPQGVAAYARPLAYATLDDLLARASGAPGLILVCDGIEDPHNLGALIRTAEASGCSGVVIPKHRAVGLTETVLKASAGAAEYVPVARVTNLTRALEELKEAGYWVAGAAMTGGRPMWDVDFRGPTALVIGGEGTGLSRLVAETCDYLVSIPMVGRVGSLNASVAGALLLYEAMRQRRPAGAPGS